MVDDLNTGLQKVHYSEVSIIQMLIIQIPTVIMSPASFQVPTILICVLYIFILQYTRKQWLIFALKSGQPVSRPISLIVLPFAFPINTLKTR